MAEAESAERPLAECLLAQANKQKKTSIQLAFFSKKVLFVEIFLIFKIINL